MEDAVTKVRQQRHRCFPNAVIVFHHENSFSATRHRNGLWITQAVFDLHRARHIEFHGRPMPDLAVDFEVAAGLLKKAVNHRQTEAASLPVRFRAEERFQDMLDDIRRYS
ncbi:hypothetical protein D3C87_1527650 [compost metagenome]